MCVRTYKIHLLLLFRYFHRMTRHITQQVLHKKQMVPVHGEIKGQYFLDTHIVCTSRGLFMERNSPRTRFDRHCLLVKAIGTNCRFMKLMKNYRFHFFFFQYCLIYINGEKKKILKNNVRYFYGPQVRYYIRVACCTCALNRYRIFAQKI